MPVLFITNLQYEINDLSGSDDHSGIVGVTASNHDTTSGYDFFSMVFGAVELLPGHQYEMRIALEDYYGNLSPWTAFVPIPITTAANTYQTLCLPYEDTAHWVLTDTTGTDDRSGDASFAMVGTHTDLMELTAPLLAGHSYTLSISVRGANYPNPYTYSPAVTVPITAALVILPEDLPAVESVAVVEVIDTFTGGRLYSQHVETSYVDDLPPIGVLSVQVQAKVDDSAWVDIPYLYTYLTHTARYPRHHLCGIHDPGGYFPKYGPLDIGTAFKYSDGEVHTVTARSRIYSVYPHLIGGWVESAPVSLSLGRSATPITGGTVVGDLVFSPSPGYSEWTKARYGTLGDPLSFEYFIPDASLVYVPETGFDPAPPSIPDICEFWRIFELRVDGGAPFVYRTRSTYYEPGVAIGQYTLDIASPTYWVAPLSLTHPSWLDGATHDVSVRLYIYNSAFTLLSSYGIGEFTDIEFPLMADLTSADYHPVVELGWTRDGDELFDYYFPPSTTHLDFIFEPSPGTTYDYLGTPWAVWRETDWMTWTPAQWVLWNAWRDQPLPDVQAIEIVCTLNGVVQTGVTSQGVRAVGTYLVPPVDIEDGINWTRWRARFAGVPAFDPTVPFVLSFQLMDSITGARSEVFTYTGPAESYSAALHLPAPHVFALATVASNGVFLSLPTPHVIARTGWQAGLPLPAPNVVAAATVPILYRVALELPAPNVVATLLAGETATVALSVLSTPTVQAWMGWQAALALPAPALVAAATVPLSYRVALALPAPALAATALVGSVMRGALSLPAPRLVTGHGTYLVLSLPAPRVRATMGLLAGAVGYAVNVETGAVTTVVLPFERMATAHGQTYGLVGTTLYRVEGDLDPGDAFIAATVRLAPHTFDSTFLKRCGTAYVQGRLLDGLTFSIIPDEQKQWDYQVNADNQQAYGAHKIALGAGIKWHSLSVVMRNRNGGRFEIGGLELLVEPLSRRPKT